MRPLQLLYPWLRQGHTDLELLRRERFPESVHQKGHYDSDGGWPANVPHWAGHEILALLVHGWSVCQRVKMAKWHECLMASLCVDQGPHGSRSNPHAASSEICRALRTLSTQTLRLAQRFPRH